jgi:hypothetical protein
MITSLCSRLSRVASLAGAFALAHFLAATALAVTNDELLPDSLVGRTLTCTYSAASPNTLEATNNFRIQFTSASTYTRSSATLTTEGGTYTLLDSSIAASTGNRGTTITFDNNWLSVGSQTSVLVVLTQQNGTGVYAASEFFNPFKNTGGTFTLSGSTGGGATTAPVISGATALTATVGSPFSYQIVASPAATSFTNAGGSATVAINPITGLVTGTFDTAGTYTFSARATNAAGTGATITFTVITTGAIPVPVFTSATTATGSVGSPFSFPISATNSPTAYSASNLPSGLALNAATGVISGTPTTAATTNVTVRAANATGTASTNLALTINGGVNASAFAGRYLGKLGSRVTSGSTVTTNTAFNDYEVLVTASGGVTVNIGALAAALTGTVAFDGTIAFVGGANLSLYNIRSAVIQKNILSSTYSDAQGNSGAQYRLEASTSFASSTIAAAPSVTSSSSLYGTVGAALSYQIAGTDSPARYTLTGAPAFLSVNAATGLVTGTPTAGGTYAFAISASNPTGTGSRSVVLSVAASAAATGVIAAPYNLTGYRNRVGQTFQFVIANNGTGSGPVWGTDVYTDDSYLISAAIHAGVLRVGETKTITVTILPGQGAYTGSSRNAISTSRYGAWGGSYSFAEAGSVTSVGAAVATAAPVAAPGFVAGTGTVVSGARLVCPVSIGGVGPFTYRWYLNGLLIPGATANPYVVESTTSANAGTYAADVTNAAGTVRIVAGTVEIAAAGAPAFTLQPYNKVVAPGGTFALAANANGAGLAYQWLRNGLDIPGETGPIILRQNVKATDSGAYAVRVTNASGSITSAPATVTLNPNAAVIANISVRTAATAGQVITPGFTIAGSGKKRVLIRASGPALVPLGITGVMADPKLDVYDGQTRINGNDTWDPALAPTFAAAGAFGFPAGSKDAALVLDLDASPSGRGYSVQVTGADNSAGIVLVEVYDLGNPVGASKLTNVSVLTKADTGPSTLILGFVLRGEGQRTLLIRGIGPKLAAFGVSGLLLDPKLQVFDNDQRVVITNNDWSGADFVSELVQASAYVGAFALDNNTTDSATLALLQPGNYTVQISGNDGGVGNALIEVYEVP